MICLRWVVELSVMGCCVVCAWYCCYNLCGCVYGASPVRFVLSLFYLCVLCVWLHLIEVCDKGHKSM